MKISRLRRALAVFLSAAMLMMCMPFGGIMAAAADETPLNDITAFIEPQRGTFPDETTERKSVMITNGKLPAGTLANNVPTCDGNVFDGWYVWSASANDDVLVNDDYTFTDDNIRENEESVTISAQWYTAYNNIYVSDYSELYYGYSTGTPSKTGDDAPRFYLDTNGIKQN